MSAANTHRRSLEVLREELLANNEGVDSFDVLKARQRAVRSKMTATTKLITEMLNNPLSSRRALRKLVIRAKEYLKEAEILNDQLVAGIPDRPGQEKQQSKHLSYVTKIDTAEEQVEEECEKRKDDASSHYKSEPSPSEAAHQREEEAQAALQRSAELHRRRLEETEKALRDLKARPATTGEHLHDFTVPPFIHPKVDEWLEDPEHLAAPPPLSEEDEAPDEWIDRYIAGRERPVRWDPTRPYSSNAHPGEFSGKALEWFTFADLFNALIHRSPRSVAEKLAALKRCLRGECTHLVIGAGEAAYKEGLRRLKAEYGDRSVMRVSHMQEIESIDLSNNPATFKKGAIIIRTHLFDLSRIGETNNADVIARISHKLHLNDRLAWNAGRGAGLERRTLNQFGDWLVDRAAAYQNPYSIAAAQRATCPTPASKKPGSTGQSGGSSFRGGGHYGKAHLATSSTPSSSSKTPSSTPAHSKKDPFCFKCEGSHRLESCDKFKELPLPQRMQFCVKHRLCFMCFIPRHSSRDCPQKKVCGQDGCILNHHALLHASTSGHTASGRFIQSESNVALGVIPIYAVGSKGHRVPINLMYDEGSNTTLFREGLIRQLRLPGYKQVLTIGGIAESQIRVPDSRRVQLPIILENGEEFYLDGSTMPVVTTPMPVTDWIKLKERWTHLADLPLRNAGSTIDVLLGANHAALMLPLETRCGKDHEPVASRSRLGWMVRGIIGLDVKPQSARVSMAFTMPELEYGTELAAALNRLYDTKSFGTEHKEKGVSVDNKRAMEILDRDTVKLDVGYRAPIIWREGEPHFQHNLPMVEGRNRSLLNRFRQNPEYEVEYRQAMEKNFSEGYAVRLSPADVAAEKPSFYLPHFGVRKRPNAKLRIVFDAAAKSHGRCLNDAICAGPALQNPLPFVIIKFREGEVAWASDIQAMYSRIRLTDKDMAYHYFIWTEVDGSETICKMTRLSFGVNCSPFVAIRTTWRAAEDGGEQMQDALAAIKSNLYIDDYLGSSSKVDEAIRIASLVRKALATGDFLLQTFTSNSSEFSAALNSTTCAADPSIIHSIGADSSEAVLGLSWHPFQDTLGFQVDRLENVVYTRIGLLSKVASLFDPQGTAAPMVIKGRIGLRRLHERGVNWNDPLTGPILDWWKQWFSTLDQLKHLEFPRCLFPDEDQIDRAELHTFCDASEEGFAAITFVRVAYKNGNVIINHVKGAIKLAPTKTLSIPKLELDAALLGARQSRFVQEALTHRIDAKFFWTDSSVVRNWIRSPSADYQVFVSHRIGEIQTLTDPKDWRFVPGKQNPADAATRSSIEAEAIPQSWLFGPSFLCENIDKWPVDLPWMAITEELRSVKVHRVVAEPPFDWNSIQILPDDIPSLFKFEGDYKDLLLRCQSESFDTDIRRLKKNKPLKPDSTLLSLTPTLGEDGLLRLGGRIGRADLPYDNLHPPLISGRHPFAVKIIQAMHERLLHVGTDFVLTHIRQHIWIVGGREAVKKIKRTCPYCIRQRAKPAVQQMADLPSCRLAAGAPPFSHTACDYFGPIETVQSRNRVAKRWGALFTCLVTRAVYLDVATSLSSDDFLLIMRRFISLYGKPSHMFSDNGTNFVGAERELREAVEQLHASTEANDFLKKEGIQWHFQPPRTPHFGGAHESLVKSTKRAMYAALNKENAALRHPTEDTLRTLLFEIAGLLNSRPLTYASSDPEDFRPLTPNDFMNRPPTADIPAGDFSTALPREHYRYVQRTTKMFWDQWRGVYLQSLIDRKKWKSPTRNLAIGDVVMEHDKNLPRGQWSTGRVVAVHPGADRLVRAVDVQFKNGIFLRGIQDLCLLEPYSADSSNEIVVQPASGENEPAKTP